MIECVNLAGSLSAGSHPTVESHMRVFRLVTAGGAAEASSDKNPECLSHA